MARYLDLFPKVLSLKDGTVITNLLVRIGVLKDIRALSIIYYPYNIQEGDTPEIIADKFYGDSEKHWVVTMLNDIHDPFYDWPMTYQQFVPFIEDKYGSQAAAQSTVHHYEQTITTTDSYSGISTPKTYVVDLNTYTNLITSSTTKTFPNGTKVTVDVSKRMVDCFTYELELNESKRKINLIKPNYIQQIQSELQNLLAV
jgi:hypothetical protein